MIKKNWDIFCKIVDNFGDIGVCWRLSQQLAHEHNINARLFVDDFTVASQIIPNLNPAPATQTINGVEILPWDAPHNKPADVAIETFSGQLPEHYVAKIRTQLPHQTTVWLNLEYLSAETWVHDAHGLPSIAPDSGLEKTYFFPGFTQQTGGLLREKTLLKERDNFIKNNHLQDSFWQKIIGQHQATLLQSAIKISLFCYHQANLHALLNALAQTKEPILILLPATPALDNIMRGFKLAINQTTQMGQLYIHALPFLSQADYDRLLWACDLNFVRGEDSWIRAIWAGKPFIWQPYIQKEDAHIKKLNAFLDLYLDHATSNLQSQIRAAHLAWSQAAPLDVLSFMQHLHDITTYTLAQSNHFSQLPSLSTQLVQWFATRHK